MNHVSVIPTYGNGQRKVSALQETLGCGMIKFNRYLDSVDFIVPVI